MTSTQIAGVCVQSLEQNELNCLFGVSFNKSRKSHFLTFFHSFYPVFSHFFCLWFSMRVYTFYVIFSHPVYLKCIFVTLFDIVLHTIWMCILCGSIIIKKKHAPIFSFCLTFLLGNIVVDRISKDFDTAECFASIPDHGT